MTSNGFVFLLFLYLMKVMTEKKSDQYHVGIIHNRLIEVHARICPGKRGCMVTLALTYDSLNHKSP